MDEDDARRFAKSGGGIRQLKASDVPDVDALDGAEEIEAAQQRMMEKIQKAAERKGNAICTDFLTAKKRADEADAKVEAVQQRQREFKKEQAAMWKAKRIELQKGEEKRQAQASKAAEERAKYEDELEVKAAEKLRAARERRAQRYSTENMKEQFEKSVAKREAGFNNAIEQQARTLARIEAKQEATAESLARNRAVIAEDLEEKRRAAQENFQKKQIVVLANEQKRQETVDTNHSAFMQKFCESKFRGRDEIKQKSKSTGALHKKATDKATANYIKVEADRSNFHEDLLGKHEAGATRVATYTKPMKFKCGNDVFTNIEVKEKTFGDLQQRRWKELKTAQESQSQALCIKIAERQALQAVKDTAAEEVKRKRTEAAKNTLKYSNEASEVFLRIQSEPNVSRIAKAMEGLGFKMPVVGGAETEEEVAK